jgi:hypothetical protein
MFKSIQDTTPSTKAQEEPQCMKDLPKEQQGRQPLTDEQFTIAGPEVIRKDFMKLAFPRTMKLHVDPPLNGQFLGLVSFIPSKNATPDSQGCYGVLKLRGCFHDERQADSWAENIVRNHDSYAHIDFVYVGKPFPLLRDNEMYRESTREIDIRRKVDEVQRDELKKQREVEKAEMESVQQRHRDLLRSVEEEKDHAIDDLELYTQLRTKKAHLIFNREELTRKITESGELIQRVSNEIVEMDRAHPEYKNEFLKRYTDALAAAGITADKNPLIKYMGE